MTTLRFFALLNMGRGSKQTNRSTTVNAARNSASSTSNIVADGSTISSTALRLQQCDSSHGHLPSKASFRVDSETFFGEETRSSSALSPELPRSRTIDAPLESDALFVHDRKQPINKDYFKMPTSATECSHHESSGHSIFLTRRPLERYGDNASFASADHRVDLCGNITKSNQPKVPTQAEEFAHSHRPSRSSNNHRLLEHAKSNGGKDVNVEDDADEVSEVRFERM